jgi:LuxR family maltose regulon positive regulatory protein
MTGDTADALDWLENESPDEIKDFVILDRYLYMLKMRLYIITGQWQRTRFLAAKLKNYFESYDRPYMRIQLHILEAQIYRRTHSDRWRGEMTKALALAKKYRLVRVIADEGMPALNMLRELKLPQEEWEQSVITLTRLQAANYPAYMEVNAERPEFSEKEQHVYELIIKGYRNAKIGQILGVTERTVKHYVSEIYKKLGVESRAEAIAKATELGDIR